MEEGWLVLHESGTFVRFTQAGAAVRLGTIVTPPGLVSVHGLAEVVPRLGKSCSWPGAFSHLRRFVIAGRAAHIRPMSRRSIELPAVARRFVEDMRAYQQRKEGDQARRDRDPTVARAPAKLRRQAGTDRGEEMCRD